MFPVLSSTWGATEAGSDVRGTAHHSSPSLWNKSCGKDRGQRADRISKSESGLMGALMEFALLVELTIIRQLKLKWVRVSVWPVSAVKPRCKYWYNLRERLIPSLSHIQGFNSYFPRNKKGKGAQHQGGGKVRRMERRRQMQRSARSKSKP